MKRQVFFLVVMVLIGWFCVYAHNVRSSLKAKEAIAKYDSVVKERDILQRAYILTSKNDDKKQILDNIFNNFSFTNRDRIREILMIKEQFVVEENKAEATK